MYTVILVIHMFVALLLIGIVLLQKGKGATIGAAFGGSSQTMFGPRGPATALAKITTGAAILFMVTSITLSTLKNSEREASVIEQTEPAALPTTLPPEGAPALPPLEIPTGDTGPTSTPAQAPVDKGDEPIGPTGQ